MKVNQTPSQTPATVSLFEKHIEAGLNPADLKYLKAAGHQQGIPERVWFGGFCVAIE